MPACTRRLAIPFALATFLALVPGCIRKTSNTTVKHEEGRVVEPGTPSWAWMAIDEETYLRFQNKIKSSDAAEKRNAIIKEGDPDDAKRRVAQKWLDAFHYSMGKAFPAAVENVPPPRAVVLRDALTRKGPNASAFRVNVCISLPGAKHSDNYGTRLFHTWYALGFSDACVRDPRFDAAWEKIARAHMERNPGCSITKEGDKFKVTSSCLESGGAFRSTDLDSTLKVLVQSDVVEIGEALFSVLDETQFAAVMAHELGHYYKAHLTTAVTPELFFYEEFVIPKSGRPVPSSKAKEIGDALLPLERHIAHEMLPGQRLSSWIHWARISDDPQGLSRVCTTAPCRAACDFPPIPPDVANFPDTSLVESKAADFLAYESTFLKCAGALPAGTATSAVIHEKLAFIFDRDSAPKPKGETMRAELEALSADLEARRVKALDLLERGRNAKLGYYTHEQEADEVSLELLQRVRIPAQAGIDAQARIARFIAKRRGAPEPVSDETAGITCLAHIKAWQAGEATAPYIPPIPLANLHHEACYRIRNMSLEMFRHGYTTTTGGPRVALEADWSTFSK